MRNGFKGRFELEAEGFAVGGGGVMEVRGIAGAAMSSVSESGALLDGGAVGLETAGARAGGVTKVGLFATAGATREFGMLPF